MTLKITSGLICGLHGLAVFQSRFYLDKNDDIHSHNTRLKDSVHLYRPNTGFSKRSLKYKAAKFYSNLPDEIRFDLGDSVR